MDKIIREFRVMRGEREMIYPFTTYSCVLDTPKFESRLQEKVFTYLKSLLLSGVPLTGSCESVSARSPIVVPTERKRSDLVNLAFMSEYRGRTNRQHECVQRFLLKNDPFTIATEVPVWDETFLGHIDILRLFHDRIQVSDFKPNAHKEKKAGSQVKTYIILLAKALRLPLSCFEGVYFDDKNSYFLT